MRKVEVDLETGRKKSWVESMEQEVVDLTGETSAMKPNRSPMMDRTNLLNVQTGISKRSRSRLPVTDSIGTLHKCKNCNFFFCKC